MRDRRNKRKDGIERRQRTTRRKIDPAKLFSRSEAGEKLDPNTRREAVTGGNRGAASNGGEEVEGGEALSGGSLKNVLGRKKFRAN